MQVSYFVGGASNEDNGSDCTGMYSSVCMHILMFSAFFQPMKILFQSSINIKTVNYVFITGQ